jgi:hypothetical protein
MWATEAHPVPCLKQVTETEKPIAEPTDGLEKDSDPTASELFAHPY